jgi:hypothetical protein
MPDFPVLTTLYLEACRADGRVIARNFIHYFVTNGYPPLREELFARLEGHDSTIQRDAGSSGRQSALNLQLSTLNSQPSTPHSLILRAIPADWHASEWSGGRDASTQASSTPVDRELERAMDASFGDGHGYFEWLLPITRAELARCQTARSRLRVLCEASSCRTARPEGPQTDDDIFPTTLQLSLNGVPIYQGTLRNHPHDARGVLTYLRGGNGAYGYLVRATAEGHALRRILAAHDGAHLRLRAAVPKKSPAQGGLTIYGAECGRYPVAPTVILES